MTSTSNKGEQGPHRRIEFTAVSRADAPARRGLSLACKAGSAALAASAAAGAALGAYAACLTLLPALLLWRRGAAEGRKTRTLTGPASLELCDDDVYLTVEGMRIVGRCYADQVWSCCRGGARLDLAESGELALTAPDLSSRAVIGDKAMEYDDVTGERPATVTVAGEESRRQVASLIRWCGLATSGEPPVAKL